MARYPMDYDDRIWIGGRGFEDGDSDVEYGYSTEGFGRGNHGGRSLPHGRSLRPRGRESGYDRPYGQAGTGYDTDLGAQEALRRQLREERRFQRERAAPGENRDRGREEPYVDDAQPSNSGQRLDLKRWQPRETPTAGDLMTENPEVVTAEMSLTDAARKMRDLNVGIIPVVDDLQNRGLQGVITDRDIAIRAVAEGKAGTTKVQECMTQQVETCYPDDRVRDVLHVMEREQVRRVPIIDHAGSLVGIIAQADLAVDFAEGEQHRELRVENAIQRISAPARPRRGRPGYDRGW